MSGVNNVGNADSPKGLEAVWCPFQKTSELDFSAVFPQKVWIWFVESPDGKYFSSLQQNDFLFFYQHQPSPRIKK